MPFEDEVSQALDAFEKDVLDEVDYLHEPDPRMCDNDPTSEEDYRVSRELALNFARAFHRISSARFTRGLPVERPEDVNSLKSIKSLFSNIEAKARAKSEATRSGVTFPGNSGAFDKLCRSSCTATFRKHSINVKRFDEENFRQNQEPYASQSPELAERVQTQSNLSMTESREDGWLGSMSIAPLWPSFTGDPTSEQPQKVEEPIQVFKWTNGKGESVSTDYSSSYNPVVASRPRRSPAGRQSQQLVPTPIPEAIKTTEAFLSIVPEKVESTCIETASALEEETKLTKDTLQAQETKTPSKHDDPENQETILVASVPTQLESLVVDDRASQLSTCSEDQSAFHSSAGSSTESMDDVELVKEEKVGLDDPTVAIPSPEVAATQPNTPTVFAEKTALSTRSSPVLAANSVVCVPATGQKKKKGERKYTATPTLATLGISFTISLKKCSAKPTIVLSMDQKDEKAARDILENPLAQELPTNAIGDSVLIVKFPFASSAFHELAIAEAKAELTVRSIGHMLKTAIAMERASKETWPADKQTWKWETKEYYISRNVTFRRVAGSIPPEPKRARSMLRQTSLLSGLVFLILVVFFGFVRQTWITLS